MFKILLISKKNKKILTETLQSECNKVKSLLEHYPDASATTLDSWNERYNSLQEILKKL